MKILVKFPVKGRVDKFFKTFNQYHSMANDIGNMQFSITCDFADPAMNNPDVIQRIKSYPNSDVVFCNNHGKVEAINNGMPSYDYDIILLASDDMIPVMQGYDKIIRDLFSKHFPDTDGVVWFNDGLQADRLNTLCILGRKYYERFGYIYHPSYRTLFADNEFTEVSKKLGRVVYVDAVVIKHEHPSLTNTKDAMNFHDDKFIDIDKKNLIERMKKNFDMKE
jgi:CheY-like chemotaxis protein